MLSLSAERTDKYIAKLDVPLESNECRAGQSSKLAGAIEWFDSAVTGRQPRAFLWPIRDQERAISPRPLSPALRAALFCIREILRKYPARTIYHSELKRTYFIGFTDARGRAKAASDATWGHERIAGVLISEAVVLFFSISAKDFHVALWLPPDRESRINEAESVGALLLLHTFGEQIHGADVLLLIDSKAAEGTLIKNYSRSPFMVSIAGAFWQQVGVVDAAVWISHVPSKANLADGPSWGDYSDALRWGWERVAPVVPRRTSWARLLHEVSSERNKHAMPLTRNHKRQMRVQGR